MLTRIGFERCNIYSTGISGSQPRFSPPQPSWSLNSFINEGRDPGYIFVIVFTWYNVGASYSGVAYEI